MLSLVKHLAVFLFSFWVSAPNWNVRGAQFINLDFEMGSTNSSLIEFKKINNGLTPFLQFAFGTGPAADLLPGWKVFIGGVETNIVAVDNGYYGSDPMMRAFAGLLSRGTSYLAEGSGRPKFPIDGKYALIMDNIDVGGRRPVWVEQTGEVPEGAKLLKFKSFRFVAFFALNINDVWFEYFFDDGPIKRDPDEMRYFFDISPWAGKTITLGFSLPHDAPAVIDSIAFLVETGLEISRASDENGIPTGAVTIHFQTKPNRDHFVEYSDSPGSDALWQPVPGGPHNSGSVLDTPTSPQRFYRLRIVIHD